MYMEMTGLAVFPLGDFLDIIAALLWDLHKWDSVSLGPLLLFSGSFKVR